MRAKSVLILALVVVALAAFAWFVDRDRRGTEERRRLADRVLSLAPDEIRGITIERQEQTVVLEREAGEEEESDDTWWLRRPLEAPADEAKVTSLVNALADLDSNRRLEDVALADYGLASPRWRLVIEAGDDSVEMAIGDELAALDRVAVSLDGSIVELVPGGWLSQLEPGGTGWRSPRLFRHQRDDIQRVRLVTDSRSVELRRGDNGFQVAEPFADRADRSLVDSLLAAITGLDAVEYLTDPPSAKAGMIEVHLGAEEIWKLQLHEEGAVIADGASARVEAPDLSEALERPVEEWRARTWSPLDGYEVDTAVFVDADGETHLARVEGDWQRDREPISFSAATGPLYALAEAEAESFQPRDSLEGLEPVLSVTLTGEETTRALAMYRPGDDRCLGSVDDRDVVLELSADACDSVQGKLSEMREAETIGAQGVEADA